jgi:multidrug efflux system outer membrane protein
MKLAMRFTNVKCVRQAIARAIPCVMLLVLTSCQIPPLRKPAPAQNLPPNYNVGSSSEYSPLLGIDQFFNDPVLTNLIRQGLAGNQDLKILAEDIQIAQNEVLGRSGAYLPLVSLGAGASIEKPSKYTRNGAVEEELLIPPGRRFPNPLPDYLIAANITWQLDIWRALRNARDAAALRYLGTAEGRNYTVTRLVAEIAENYFGLMALDQRIENLNQIIVLQQRSLEIAKARLAFARGTMLGVQRFEAEVRRNQSEKLIIQQEIVQVENRINFLLGRYPQPVPRQSAKFLDLNIQTLGVGVPAQLLQNRPDIRRAERELEAAGLDVKVARARFYPQPLITAGIGYEAFNPKYLFNTPAAIAYNLAGNLVAPLVNRRAIQAEYMTANARQLQAVYNYQRVVLNAFTEVVNRVSMVENYRKSIEIKRQQLVALESSVVIANSLYQNPRAGVAIDYMDVLFASRDLAEARMVLINTKREQLSAIVNAYQALGGGLNLTPDPNQGGPSDPAVLPRPDEAQQQLAPWPFNTPQQLPPPFKGLDMPALPWPFNTPPQLPPLPPVLPKGKDDPVAPQPPEFKKALPAPLKE